MIAMIFRLYCKVIVKSKWITSKQYDLYSYNDDINWNAKDTRE